MNTDMQHHGSISRAGSDNQDGTLTVTRRKAVAGGSLLLGSLLLSACGKAAKVTSLPDTPWNPAPMTSSGPAIENPTVTIASAPSSTPQITAPSTDFAIPGGIIPRSQWARASIRSSEAFDMNGIRRITVHHDGMPPASLSSPRQIASRIEQIRQSHVVGRGWADLGYHYVIDPSGRVWEGRSIKYQGAHVKDQNENNLGILVMGNFDRQMPTPAALNTLDVMLANQMQRYGIGMSNVRTHMERAPTACPGRNLQQYMLRTRSGGGTLVAMASRVGLAMR